MTRTRESLGGLDLDGWATVDRKGGSGVNEFRAVQHRGGDSISDFGKFHIIRGQKRLNVHPARLADS